jgi:hypothetical protein
MLMAIAMRNNVFTCISRREASVTRVGGMRESGCCEVGGGGHEKEGGREDGEEEAVV